MNVLDIIKMDIKSYRFMTCCMEPGNNILFVNYHSDLSITGALAKELLHNRLEFTKNRQHYLIQHFSNIFDIDFEATNFLKDVENGSKNLLGVAFIANNKSSIELAENFINYKKKFPAKIFYAEKAAIDWIHELKEYHRVTQQ